jgi:hypothetical protein
VKRNSENIISKTIMTKNEKVISHAIFEINTVLTGILFTRSISNLPSSESSETTRDETINQIKIIPPEDTLA